MAKQIPASPSNKKISELYKRIKEGSLILQPDFQRKFVWNTAHKEAFIDTILKGLPFPEIYTAQSGVDIAKIESQEVIVDGQQRLSTILQYIEEMEDSKIFGKKVPKYKKLMPDDQKDFLNYNVVIRDLGDITSEEIREIFKRINQTKFSLEQIEIHNAVYDGEFISTAKEILKEINPQHMPIFSDSELSRMSDLHFILLIMSTLEVGGYFFRDTEVEKLIIQYNDTYENKEEMMKKILEILNGIRGLNLEIDSIWYRKSNFFTAVVEFCKVPNLQFTGIKEKLVDFEKHVLDNKLTKKDENDFALYYTYMYTGTNSRQARVSRAEIFRKYILS
ncbi:MAG TPA: DUF262 domain-containing protein [Bacteroidia bacterium]|jgi:uncharacterized protein with ParB-like and HNH nuclease domain|nr:DUF262 domain-containing protein [Bacteroidia bacterium]